MITTPNTESICPIFYKDIQSGTMEQIGSSVVIDINNIKFLLTAAHITDFLKHGFLFIPVVKGFAQLHGNYSSFNLPTGFDRDDDKVDIAYFKLNKELSNSLHPTIKSIGRSSLNLTESLVKDDLYTFAGFPLSKAKKKAEKYISEIYNFTGPAASSIEYEKYGYDDQFHILVRFNRKNSCTIDGVKQIPPHPKGISGGAVFSWPKDVKTRKKEPVFNLVGIGHTYKERQNILVATRINSFLASIYSNNPGLIDVPIEQAQKSSSIPLFAGIAWYRQEEWDRLKREFDDSEKMHKTWNEWRQASESGVEYMARKNKIFYPVLLEADAIKEYCSKYNMPNTSATRVRMVNEILWSIIYEKQV